MCGEERGRGRTKVNTRNFHVSSNSKAEKKGEEKKRRGLVFGHQNPLMVLVSTRGKRPFFSSFFFYPFAYTQHICTTSSLLSSSWSFDFSGWSFFFLFHTKSCHVFSPRGGGNELETEWGRESRCGETRKEARGEID